MESHVEVTNNGGSLHRRVVRFQETVRIKKILQIEDFSTVRERRSCSWYSKQELRSFKSESRRIATQIQMTKENESNGTHCHEKDPESMDENSNEEPVCCTRGLEFLVAPESTNRRQRIANASFAVMDEQDSQWIQATYMGLWESGPDEEEFTDEIFEKWEAVARAYSNETMESKDIARQLGKRDEMEAHEIWTQTPKLVDAVTEVMSLEHRTTRNPSWIRPSLRPVPITEARRMFFPTAALIVSTINQILITAGATNVPVEQIK